jgi:integrase
MSDEILDQIAKIEQKPSSPYLDTKVLTTALKLSYLTGLTRGELISLRIKDVLQTDGQIVPEIKSCERTVQGNVLKLTLSDEVKAILMEYLAYLKKIKYPINRNAYLFPQRTPKILGKYDETKIDRDLQKIGRGWTLSSVRHAGIRRVYKEHKSIEQAAEYARTGIKNIEHMFRKYQISERQDLEDEEGYTIIRPGYGSDQNDDWD